MGFSISDKQVRRAGLDYWEHVNVIEHHDWDDFVRSVNSDRLFYFSTKGKNVYWDHQFQKDDYLIFGSETAGLPEDLLNENKETVYTLPMPGPIRSLNLATSVGIVVYEGLRQIQL
jgi:tRNA (cytidine/uridine-2'-O-)-methyltransferase